MATITVTTLADSSSTGSDTTLREAVAQADAFDGDDIIVFDPSLFGGTITLQQSAMLVSSVITIQAPLLSDGSPAITISGADEFGIFDVYQAQLSLEGLTLTNGSAEMGGAIMVSDANVDVTNTTFTQNSAQTGGAIFVDRIGVFSAKDSRFSDNEATAGGGGAVAMNDGTVFLENSVVANNSAGSSGGAVFGTLASLYIEGGVFDANVADDNGGAIFIFGGDATIDETDFTNNSVPTSGRGGAIASAGTTSIIINGSATPTYASGDSLFASNSAGEGGAISVRGDISFRVEGYSFETNQATGTGGGGAIRMSGNGGTINSSMFVANATTSALGNGGALNIVNASGGSFGNTFDANMSEANGGAIAVTNGGLTVVSDTVFDNIAELSGGGLFFENIVSTDPSRQIGLQDAEIYSNIAGRAGGGVFFDGTVLSILSGTTFVDNSAEGLPTDTLSGGGAVYLQSGDLFAPRSSRAEGIGLDGNQAVDVGNGILNAGSGRIVVLASADANGLPSSLLGAEVIGGPADDQITTARANDMLFGGDGNDRLIGGMGNDFLGGGLGADTMFGGLGNDFYIVDNAGDRVSSEVAFSLNGGIDTVRSFVNYTQPNNVELLRLGNLSGGSNLNGTGNDAPGTIVGNAGNNVLTGRGGNDQLNGNDGNDRLIGGVGRDTLVGGAGADTFVYASISESRAGVALRDVINGFDRGADRIDLGGMDANLALASNASFDFIGFARFSGEGEDSAGELRLQRLGGPNAVLVEGDLRGDGVADFQIFVNLTTVLSAEDFIL